MEQKCPFLVMKSALFVQANVAINTKLTSKVAFLFGNFDAFKKIGQNRAISVWYDGDGKIFLSLPFPRLPIFQGKICRRPFQYPKVPLEPVPPPIF
jgi:hypothetical protein